MPDQHGVTIREKLVRLGLAPATGGYDHDAAVHAALDRLTPGDALDSRVFTLAELMREVCEARQVWGLYLSLRGGGLEDHPLSELFKAAPYLQAVWDADQMMGNECPRHQVPHEGFVQALCEERFVLFFKTEEERDRAYWQTVGDDGPTETNPYSGPARVYALTCDPDGEFGNENT